MKKVVFGPAQKPDDQASEDAMKKAYVVIGWLPGRAPTDGAAVR